MKIARCFELFLTDRKISGCSEATIRFYEYVVEKFLRYSELSQLQLTDVNLEDGFVSVLGGLHKLLNPFLTKYSQRSTFHPPSWVYVPLLLKDLEALRGNFRIFHISSRIKRLD